MSRLLVLVVAVAFLGGCVDGSDPSGAGGPAGGEDFPPEARRSVEVSGTQVLGSQKGSSLTVASYPFTVTVPAGGATSVRWELQVENGPAAGNRVEGPGCDSGGAGNVNVVVQVGLSNAVGGSCGDLSAGEHTFTAHIQTPAPTFTATVLGNV